MNESFFSLFALIPRPHLGLPLKLIIALRRAVQATPRQCRFTCAADLSRKDWTLDLLERMQETSQLSEGCDPIINGWSFEALHEAVAQYFFVVSACVPQASQSIAPWLRATPSRWKERYRRRISYTVD